MPDKPQIAFTTFAELEFEDARQWYNNKRPGLGIEFAIEVDACLERIRESPEMYSRFKKDYRQAITDRFPFAIYYEYVPGLVTVYSVFHCSQDPAKLDERLP